MRFGSLLLAGLLGLLSAQTTDLYAAEAQTYSYFSRVKLAVYGFGIAHLASYLSKKCALWEGFDVFGLQKDGLGYTAAMLDLKHANNAMSRTLFAQPVGSDNSFIQGLIRTILWIPKISQTPGTPVSPDYAPNAVVPALYKEYNGLDLTFDDKLSLEWYNAGTGFLTFWECFGLLNAAFEEWSKKRGLYQEDSQQAQQESSELAKQAVNASTVSEHELAENISLENCPHDQIDQQQPKLSRFEQYMSAAHEDQDILAWGAALFGISYIGNLIGQEVGKSATRLFVKNGMDIFKRDQVIHKYSPFFKYVDTVVSYFIAQYIKYHVFNALRTVQDYFGGYESEYHRFWDLMYRAADKGPFAWYCVYNSYMAWQMLKRGPVAQAA